MASVQVMEPTIRTSELFADLDLFLREPDSEGPFLTEPRDEREPVEALNSQILAGLVSF